MGEWQPIATAPKDGTRVLVCCPGATEPFVAHWQVHTAATWGIGNTWRDDADCTVAEPTHWMPLPAAPEVTDDK